MVPRRFTNIESTTRVLIFAIAAAYCMAAPATAQAANPAPQSQSPQATGSQSGSPAAQPVQPSQQSDSSAQPDRNASQAPPQPVTTYPDAAGTAQPTAPASDQSPDAPQPKAQQPNGQAQSEPQGAATAEKVTTAGGAAAKPAGVAIAPAKQHQARSLLIKIGAFVAAGAAAGTVYALSRGTSSTPPGANGPGVVQKK